MERERERQIDKRKKNLFFFANSLFAGVKIEGRERERESARERKRKRERCLEGLREGE